jgi:GntR family transcriptional regulator/MocR family aminotransferase
VMAQFISSGAFEQHLARMRKNYLERRNAVIAGLARTFPASATSGYEGGMHLVWETDASFPPAREFQREAKKSGVGIYSLDGGPVCRVTSKPEHDNLLLLGYACLAPNQINTAIEILERVALGSSGRRAVA